MEKLNSQKPTSLAEDSKKEADEMAADQDHRTRCGNNRSTKTAKSKREIIEDLNRERLPWEE